jgi:hypothetical protein
LLWQLDHQLPLLLVLEGLVLLLHLLQDLLDLTLFLAALHLPEAGAAEVPPVTPGPMAVLAVALAVMAPIQRQAGRGRPAKGTTEEGLPAQDRPVAVVEQEAQE